MGTEVDLHAVHFTGHPVYENKGIASAVTLMPSVVKTVDMTAKVPGNWSVYCHINDHIVGGMLAKYVLTGTAASEPTPATTYYIQAEEKLWDYLPGSVTLDEDMEVFAGTGADRIGSKYWKCLFVGYDGADFTTALTVDAENGLLGPVMRAEQGQAIKIVLKNSCTKNVSLHATGVQVLRKVEGGIAPGQTGEILWHVEHGPGAGDADSVALLYYSDVPMHTDTNSGLMGPLVVKKQGASLSGVRELFTLWSVMNEGESYLLNKSWVQAGQAANGLAAVKEDDGFMESNLMHAVNGRFYDSLKITLKTSDTLRWYLLSVGTEVDMHSVYLQGHMVSDMGQSSAAVMLMPGASRTVSVPRLLPGTWQMGCMVNDHRVGGMKAEVVVTGNNIEIPTVIASTTYLQAEEVLWDYGPSGVDPVHLGHGVSMNFEGHDDAKVFMVPTPKAAIGRKYWKCIFRGYTDSNFSTKADFPAENGILGPVIRGAQGEVVKVVLKNTCTKDVSLHAQAIISQPSQSIAAPGKTVEFKWFLDQGPGVEDADSIALLYYSDAPMHTDTNSGLMGPLVVRKPGVDLSGVREVFTLWSVMNEGESYLLNKSWVEAGNDPKALAALKEDDDFKEGNLMHAINGRLYGNLDGMRIQKGSLARWYLLALGTEVDLHTIHWHGNTGVTQGRRADVTMLMPASSATLDMDADNVGTWLLHCHVNDHIVGGMIGTYTVFDGTTAAMSPSFRPMLSSVVALLAAFIAGA
jgi:FtsP/CotA-like multicopper oxidase with cupredoxin domain